MANPASTSSKPPTAAPEVGSGMDEPIFNLTLMINKETNKVLFAECGLEAIVGLSRLLQMPFRDFAPLLGNPDRSSMRRLHESLDSIGAFADLRPKPRTYYRCLDRPDCLYLTEYFFNVCPSCRGPMATPATAPAPAKKRRRPEEKSKSFKFWLMDDLTVENCIYTVSAVAMLCKLNVADLSVVEQRVVKVGFREAMSMMMKSFFSSTVLTDVFLANEVEPVAEEAEISPEKAKCKPIRRSVRRRSK